MLFFVGAHAQNSVEKVKIGDTMPQFTLNSDVYGQVTPSDLKREGGAGKVCLLLGADRARKSLQKCKARFIRNIKITRISVCW